MISQFWIEVAGWIYFLTWSLSFYPQVLLNYKLKNVEGMNLDFLTLNLSGYIFYTIYCSYGYYYPNAKQETGMVDLHDLLFAAHALVLTSITTAQAFIYPKGKNKINPITIGYLIAIWAFIICYFLLTQNFKLIKPTPQFSVISFMGYFKLSISFLKCWPQMIWNFKRKSTKGWSTFANLLDLIGGFFGFLQILMQHHNNNALQINGIKLCLALLSMVYDTVFLTQRYCIYPPNENECCELELKEGGEKQTQRNLDQQKRIQDFKKNELNCDTNI